MPNIIIAIVGMCGTGKSVAAKYIQDTFHIDTIYFGGFVLEEVKNRNLEINSSNEKLVREDLRRIFGPAVMAIKAFDSINSYVSGGSDVIIDGLYSFSEYVYLEEKFGRQLVLVAVHSPKKLRYQRLGTRETRPLTPQEVDERDFFEIKNIEKAGPIAIADYHIVNDSDFQNMYHQIDTIFKEIVCLRPPGTPLALS